MDDREQIIAELEKCLHGIEHDQKRLEETGCVMTTYAQTRKRIKAIADALALLKSQEPRILAPVEYKEWCVGNRKTPLLIERRRIHKKKHEMYWLNDPEGAVHVDEEYGKSFVVWTGWPSDAQQKAVKWE